MVVEVVEEVEEVESPALGEYIFELYDAESSFKLSEHFRDEGRIEEADKMLEEMTHLNEILIPETEAWYDERVERWRDAPTGRFISREEWLSRLMKAWEE